ncbi:MAG: aminotransferase class I/II-fold pyridoxal phosphate-dependent enzyme [Candidatus Obscuribacter sp.]|nr:aminotransferase class I/II-fold pyridoxal phosphate-dependent enzyme [Candidatus Obscuribacter sp.]
MSKVLSVPKVEEILVLARQAEGTAANAPAETERSQDLLTLLSRLCAALDCEEERRDALACLHGLAAALEKENLPALQLKTVSLPGLDCPIRLLLTKAVFSPEFWGRTFAEGLLKGKEQFRGRKIVEVGTGSGWISLLLLFFTHVKEVVGLDLNPVAITMARLNTWLNGTKSTAPGEFSLRLSLAGDPIVSAFRVEVSDLLSGPLARGEKFDHVIGCIPQVLHPKPLVLPGKQSVRRGEESETSVEGFSEEDLYDLSNYCFEQGILEDRFGLPLIASALEQSQLLLNQGGKVTLVLGGRPGRQAIESMFERRGLDARLVWMRRIQQADDTDLASLVELEKSYDIRFHFFMSRESDAGESVSAATAVKLLASGRPVYHDLLVYEAVTRFEPHVFDFVRNLSQLHLTSLRKELDFSRLQEERVSFLSRLSQSMLESRALPYPHERGDMSIRELLARYLNGFCYYPVEAADLFIAPSRAELSSIIFKLCTEKQDRILLSSTLSPVYIDAARQAGLDITVGNDDLSELCQLDDLVAPRLVLISPKQLAFPSPITIKALAQQAAKHPERIYLIDDSEHFLISSHLGANMTLRLAAQEDLPPNLILLYGLVKNTISPDLQLSFLINAPQSWLSGLDIGAELSYSRIAYPTQLLYQWLFEDLMTFPFSDNGFEDAGILKEKKAQQVSKLSPLITEIEQDPVFAPKPVDPESAGIIRLDYGEFEAAPPDILIKSLFKGFIDEETHVLPQIVQERICAYVKFTRHVGVSPRRVVLAQGVFPLFGAFIQAMTARLGRPPLVAVPDGSYGPLYPMLKYYGAEIMELPTSVEKAYLISSRDLQGLSPKPDVLWLTQPNNPSGVFFDPEKLRNIVDVCYNEDIYIFSDEIFFLLSDHRLGRWTPSSLSAGSYSQGHYQSKIFMVDGVAKSFASGGMRLGFLLAPDETWAADIQRYTASPPLAFLRAWDGLYSAFLDKSPNHMLDVSKVFTEVESYLMEKRRSLSQHREQLLTLLRRYNLDDGYDTPYRGGLFLLGKLTDRHEKLARNAGLLTNPGEWSRTGPMVRLCYCLEEGRFQTAMERLKTFLAEEFAEVKGGPV